MVKFWDTSAVMPLLVVESTSDALRQAAKSDTQMVAWWGTRIECVSAITRRARENGLSAADRAQARQELAVLAAHWSEVQPTDEVRTMAERIVSVHSLRAADAIQLAAAMAASDGATANLPFVSLDTRLREAAVREGFTVLPATAARATALRERAPRRKQIGRSRRARP